MERLSGAALTNLLDAEGDAAAISYRDINQLFREAAAAIEAKDAEIADADHLADLQQKEIERLRAHIDGLREGLGLPPLGQERGNETKTGLLTERQVSEFEAKRAIDYEE
jgi:hypothetical protein